MQKDGRGERNMLRKMGELHVHKHGRVACAERWERREVHVQKEGEEIGACAERWERCMCRKMGEVHVQKNWRGERCMCRKIGEVHVQKDGRGERCMCREMCGGTATCAKRSVGEEVYILCVERCVRREMRMRETFRGEVFVQRDVDSARIMDS